MFCESITSTTLEILSSFNIFCMRNYVEHENLKKNVAQYLVWLLVSAAKRKTTVFRRDRHACKLMCTRDFWKFKLLCKWMTAPVSPDKARFTAAFYFLVEYTYNSLKCSVSVQHWIMFTVFLFVHSHENIRIYMKTYKTSDENGLDSNLWENAVN